MKASKLLGGFLLVSGTAIGAGMLALPVATAHHGFIPSTLAFLICWFFMTIAALLLLEVNLQLPAENDLISMVSSTLGGIGKAIAWIAYLLLLYALIAAYIQGSVAWFMRVLSEYHIHLSLNLAVILFTFITGLIVAFGIGFTEHLNRYLALGMMMAYFILIARSISHVDVSKLNHIAPAHLPFTFPLIMTAFGFSVVVPTLSNYLEQNVKAIRRVIISGSFAVLIIYVLWEMVALGIIPLKGGSENYQVLATQRNNGTGVAIALQNILQDQVITLSSRWFSIFAILTSLLGVSLALMSFLADGLQWKAKKGLKHFVLLMLAYLPPLLFVIFYPSGFGRILSFAGVFVAILLGIFPALMVWCQRYHAKVPSQKYRVAGGKALLILVMMFFSYITYLEMINCLVCPSR